MIHTLNRADAVMGDAWRRPGAPRRKVHTCKECGAPVTGKEGASRNVRVSGKRFPVTETLCESCMWEVGFEAER